MPAAPAIAKPAKITAALDQTEVEALNACLAVARPNTLWGRFKRGFSSAISVTTREEFDAVCEAAVKLIDGQTLHPDQAAKKAQKVVTAGTNKSTTAICAKCDTTETAVLTVFLGAAPQGFWFNRAIKLKDPKGSRRG